MTGPRAQRRRGSEKIGPAVAALIVNAVIGYALIIGLRPSPLLQRTEEATLALFDLKPPAPEKPAPIKAEKIRKPEERGGGAPAPAPAARREQQIAETPITAPAPLIPLPAPPFPAAAPAGPIIGIGSAGEGGAGSGGVGDGGAGTGTGAGTGSGGDGGAFSRAKQTAGRFRNSDFPSWLRGVGRVKIGVRYAIGPSGHVDQCEVIERSGYAEVDAMTCRIIVERYRFRPARDPEGYAVSEVREEDYRWQVR
ncbi:MAG TPA: energy transducer TonB [Sphingobium sp.]|nr:energy transducer TonB [Sphingobium sp.]